MLEIRDLKVNIEDKEILKGIDLDVNAGEIHAVMGPNGAGKSVLIRLLHGLLEPDAGTISWNGDPAGSASRARHIVGENGRKGMAQMERTGRRGREAGSQVRFRT